MGLMDLADQARVSEQPVSFGDGDHLTGTVTTASAFDAQRPGVVLVNAGVIHRIGPHRLYVKLARALAARGHAVIRFDLSGQGDSRLPPTPVAMREQFARDVVAAMDCLAATAKVTQLVLIGICSGAINVYDTALADARVGGIVMIDGLIYRTPRARLRHLRMGLRRRTARQWADSLRDLGARVIARIRPARAGGTAEAEERSGEHHTLKPAFAASMQSLLDRGARVNLCFTGSYPRLFNYEGQTRDAFPNDDFVGRIDETYLPQIDHTATLRQSQAILIDELLCWVDSLRPSQKPLRG